MVLPPVSSQKEESSTGWPKTLGWFDLGFRRALESLSPSDGTHPLLLSVFPSSYSSPLLLEGRVERETEWEVLDAT